MRGEQWSLVVEIPFVPPFHLTAPRHGPCKAFTVLQKHIFCSFKNEMPVNIFILMCELLERRNYVFPFLSEDFYSISSILLTLYLLQEYAKKDVGGFGPRAPMAEHLAGDLFLNKEFTGYAHLLLPESLIFIYFPDCFVCLFLISS